MQKESFTQSQGSVLFDHFHYTSLRNMRKLVCVCECKKRISGAILIIFFAHSFRFGLFFVDFIKKNIIFAYFHCKKTADSSRADKAQKPHKKFQDQNKKIFSAQKCSSLHACKILFELINIQYAFGCVLSERVIFSLKVLKNVDMCCVCVVWQCVVAANLAAINIYLPIEQTL